jgi:hypothetical protein
MMPTRGAPSSRFANGLTALIATIPYGILADKYGRRPILFFSMLGLFLQLGWVQIPRKLPCNRPASN